MKTLLHKIISFDERVLNQFITKIVVSFCTTLVYVVILMIVTFIWHSIFHSNDAYKVTAFLKFHIFCGSCCFIYYFIKSILWW